MGNRRGPSSFEVLVEAGLLAVTTSCALGSGVEIDDQRAQMHELMERPETESVCFGGLDGIIKAVVTATQRLDEANTGSSVCEDPFFVLSTVNERLRDMGDICHAMGLGDDSRTLHRRTSILVESRHLRGALERSPCSDGCFAPTLNRRIAGLQDKGDPASERSACLFFTHASLEAKRIDCQEGGQKLGTETDPSGIWTPQWVCVDAQGAGQGVSHRPSPSNGLK